MIEHQARQAARVGAAPIILLVERLPPALTAAIDRLRADGVPIEVARTVADAADRIHPEEALLLIADGCIAAQDHVDRLARAVPPALLVTGDRAADAAFELIDADARWAGIALFDGSLMRETAAMLGEWDLASTLLRRAVQHHAVRIVIDPTGDPAIGALPVIIDRVAKIEPVERALLAHPAGAHEGDWAWRLLVSSVARLAAPALLNRVPEPSWLGAAGALLALIAAPLIALGWWGAALVPLLLSGALAASGARLAAVRLLPLGHGTWLGKVRIAALALAPIALASKLVEAGQWGWWLVAGVLIGAAAALGVERRMVGDRLPGAALRWLAGPDSLLWLFTALAIGFGPAIALVGATAYAVGSFAVLQRTALRHISGLARS